MEEVTARVYLVSISRSRYSAVYVGGHAKTALLHAAISAAAHQMCEMLMNVQFRSCRDERSELSTRPGTGWDHVRLSWRSLDLILYWKILCSNFLQYKVPAPGSRSGRGYFSRFFAFGVFKHVIPNWVDMLRGGLPRMFEKFYN